MVPCCVPLHAVLKVAYAPTVAQRRSPGDERRGGAIDASVVLVPSVGIESDRPSRATMHGDYVRRALLFLIHEGCHL